MSDKERNNEKLDEETDWHLKRGFNFGQAWGYVHKNIYEAREEEKPEDRLRKLKDSKNYLKEMWEILEKYEGDNWLAYHYKALEQYAETCGFKLSREGITIEKFL